MKRFVIEREMPDIGKADRETLKGASQKSNDVLAELGKQIQWDHSYVVGDMVYCVYIAENKEIIEKHAELSGFPANKISEVMKIIDPTTAGSD